jgi:hypothetical protein
VAAAADSQTVAIGAPYNDGNGVDSEHVRAFGWSGTAEVHRGDGIDGEAANDFSGSLAAALPNASSNSAPVPTAAAAAAAAVSTTIRGATATSTDAVDEDAVAFIFQPRDGAGADTSGRRGGDGGSGDGSGDSSTNCGSISGEACSTAEGHQSVQPPVQSAKPPVQSAKPLLADECWVAFKTVDGTCSQYFWNSQTDAVVWTLPDPMPSVWTKHFSVGELHAGNPYYHNKITGESRWRLPRKPDAE